MTTTQTITQDSPDNLREAFLQLAENVESLEQEIAQRQGFTDRQAAGSIKKYPELERFRRLLKTALLDAMRIYNQLITVGSEHASEPYIVSFVKKHLPSLHEQTMQENYALRYQLGKNAQQVSMLYAIANTKFIKD